MRLWLAVPAPFHALSGGAIYDGAIIDGLRALGHDVSVQELAGAHPLPDNAAYAAAAQASQQAPEGSRPLIDGACLPAFAPLADALVAHDAAALVHHPTALETGRDADSRERLRAIEQSLLPQLRRVIVTSADTARRLAADFGVDAERIRVVEPGTPDAPRSPAPAVADRCMLLSIGTLLPRKGHDVLLRALARLPDLDWTLSIVGGARDAAYERELHHLAETLGIASRVDFAGELGAATLEPLWQQAAVFALASHYEGYGMVVAEALRRGVPVAITTGAALAATLPAEAGVIAAPGDVAALSNALRRLVFDTDLRRIMADGAWAYGRTLPDWDAQVLRFADALED
jgi:glycosyltransferase involved in cell wall biosynthesis